jgi:hypothetical protein
MFINSLWFGRNMMSKLRLFAGVLFVFWLGGVLANSTQPSFVSSLIPGAELKATGSFRWFGLKIYDAALWLPASAEVGVPYQRSFALKLTYARRLSGQAIAESSADEMERLEQGKPLQRKEWLKKMLLLFPDVKAGDAITGVFQPGQGVLFYLNQDLLGAIEDEAFGRAFFAIWFDERTRAPELRASLLDQKQ